MYPRRSSGRDVSAVRRPVLASRRLVWANDPVVVSDMTTPVVEPVVRVTHPDRSEATKAELIAEAEARGLDTSGNKPDILARLEASDG